MMYTATRGSYYLKVFEFDAVGGNFQTEVIGNVKLPGYVTWLNRDELQAVLTLENRSQLIVACGCDVQGNVLVVDGEGAVLTSRSAGATSCLPSANGRCAVFCTGRWQSKVDSVSLLKRSTRTGITIKFE